MIPLFEWLKENPATVFVAGSVLAIVLSAAARALPVPNGEGKFYYWLYWFAQELLANYDKVTEAKERRHGRKSTSKVS